MPNLLYPTVWRKSGSLVRTSSRTVWVCIYATSKILGSCNKHSQRLDARVDLCKHIIRAPPPPKDAGVGSHCRSVLVRLLKRDLLFIANTCSRSWTTAVCLSSGVGGASVRRAKGSISWLRVANAALVPKAPIIPQDLSILGAKSLNQLASPTGFEPVLSP